jgi:DNA primase
LSEDHIRLLKRFTTDITLVFDGDAAGRKAMVRALEPFLATGIIPKVVILPQDKDPDDMARTDINLWNTLVAEARSIWDFIFDESFRGRDPSKFEHQSTILKDLAPMIARENDSTVRDLLVERLAVRLGLGMDTVARQVRSKGEPVVLSHGQTRDYTETDLVRLMLFDEHAIQAVKTLKLAREFKQQDTAALVGYLLEHGNCILNDMECPDTIRSAAARIMAQGPYEGDGAKALKDNVSKLLSNKYDSQITKLQQAIDQARQNSDKLDLHALLNERFALVKAKRNIHTTVAEALEGK